MEKALKVIGRAKIKSPADTIELEITLTALDKNYAKTTEMSEAKAGALISALTKVGFDEKQIKTASFYMSSKTIGAQDEKGNYKEEFLGYESYRVLHLSFKLDITKLSLVLDAISGCGAEAKFNISFSVCDKNAVKKQLLTLATEDAKVSAQIIAKAAGVKLGEIISINYDTSQINLYSPVRFEMQKMSVAEQGFTPEDIENEESVEMVWSLL